MSHSHTSRFSDTDSDDDLPHLDDDLPPLIPLDDDLPPLEQDRDTPPSSIPPTPQVNPQINPQLHPQDDTKNHGSFTIEPFNLDTLITSLHEDHDLALQNLFEPANIQRTMMPHIAKIDAAMYAKKVFDNLGNQLDPTIRTWNDYLIVARGILLFAFMNLIQPLHKTILRKSMEQSAKMFLQQHRIIVIVDFLQPLPLGYESDLNNLYVETETLANTIHRVAASAPRPSPSGNFMDLLSTWITRRL